MRGVTDRNAEAAAGLRSWAEANRAQLEVIEMDVADSASVLAAAEACNAYGVNKRVCRGPRGAAPRRPRALELNTCSV